MPEEVLVFSAGEVFYTLVEGVPRRFIVDESGVPRLASVTAKDDAASPT